MLQVDLQSNFMPYAVRKMGKHYIVEVSHLLKSIRGFSLVFIPLFFNAMASEIDFLLSSCHWYLALAAIYPL